MEGTEGMENTEGMESTEGMENTEGTENTEGNEGVKVPGESVFIFVLPVCYSMPMILWVCKLTRHWG